MLGESFRNLHHAMINMLRLKKINQCADWFAPIASKYKSLYIQPFNSARELAHEWRTLDENLSHRIKMAKRYNDRLKGGPWLLPTMWQHSGVCWRYTLLLDRENLPVLVTEKLREAGLLASNHYWPLHPFYLPSDHCTNAEIFARRCLNLWVDKKADEASADRCADILIESQHSF